jgi:hypothetical protein
MQNDTWRCIMIKGNSLKISLLLVVGLSLAACGMNSATANQAPTSSPTEVVESFYSWYLDNLGHDPEAEIFRKPSEDELEARPELSNEVLSLRLETLASFGEVGGYDPLICAQDVPNEIQTELVSNDNNEARVLVSTDFSGHQFTVRLKAADGWQIVEVICHTD